VGASRDRRHQILLKSMSSTFYNLKSVRQAGAS